MNLFPHQIAKGLIDRAVAGDRVHPLELVGYNNQAIVAAAARRSAMPGMKGAFVGQLQALRFQYR